MPTMAADRVRETLTIFNAAFGDPEGDAARRYVDCYADDVVLHGFPPGVETKSQLIAHYQVFWGAFPDGRTDPEHIIADGDWAAVRFRTTGTFQGPLLGLEPTGQPIVYEGMTFVRFDADGRIAERWNRGDDLGLFMQIGMIAPPVSPAA